MGSPRPHEETLFAAALALSQAERAAFVSRECAGDAALAARVHALLLAHEGGDTLRGVGEARALLEERPGDLIDRYKLLQRLGEGGWGVVWMAEQQEPVHRRVALKVIKLGMDTKAVVARFEAERQALAMMDHPNIAKVLDGGATKLGRPYFVMELVRGVRITDYCEKAQTSTRERLELFCQVCHAVHHAHQTGIIHRDLKPSNILVAVIDGVPVPKVIDFGVAKTTHGRLTNATVVTGVEQFIGTPAYMSPEQADLSPLDIDSRTDIYSIGIILYELLTGRPPFDPKTLSDAGVEEIRRIIREVDPPRPSTLLAALPAEDFRRIARQRATVPAELFACLDGELDWIVMKALEKQRHRRYENAAAFAADIQRFLRSEPVIARPPTALYRVRKFSARHKAAAIGVVAVALALVMGTAVSTWQAVKARAAQDVAVRESREARRSHERAEKLVAFMLGELRGQLEKVGRLDVMESVAAEAMAYFSDLDPQALTDTTLAQQARALFQIGELRTTQFRYPEAAAAFATAYERAAALSARYPKSTRMLFERGQAEFGIGALHRRSGALTEAQEWLTRYRDTAAALLTLEPVNPDWQTEMVMAFHNLAVVKKDAGDLAGARSDFLAKRAALAVAAAAAPGDLKLKARLADTESWLGNIAEQMGDFRAAILHFETESRTLDELQAVEPNNMGVAFDRADSLSFQTRLLLLTNQHDAARERLAQCRQLIDRLTAHDPANHRWARSSHLIRLRQALLSRAQGRLAEAEQLATRARQGLESLVTDSTRDWLAATELVAARRDEAELHAMRGDPRAQVEINIALQAIEGLFKAQPTRLEVIAQLATTLMSASRIADQKGDDVAGRAFAQRAFELVAERIELSQDWRLLDPAARALARLGRTEEGLRVRRRLEQMGYAPLIAWPPIFESATTTDHTPAGATANNMKSYEIVWSVAITFGEKAPEAEYTLLSSTVPEDWAIFDPKTGDVTIHALRFQKDDDLKIEYRRSGTNFSFKGFKFDQRNAADDPDGTKTFPERGSPPHKIHFKNKRNIGAWKLSYDIEKAGATERHTIDPEIVNDDTVILTPGKKTQP